MAISIFADDRGQICHLLFGEAGRSEPHWEGTGAVQAFCKVHLTTEAVHDAWHHLGLLVFDPEDEPNHQKRQDLIDTGDKPTAEGAHVGDQVNDAERRAINEAIEAAKLQRVWRTRKEAESPPIDWESISRCKFSKGLDRTLAKRHYGGEVSVREILKWAFRVERAQLELPRQHDVQIYASGFGMEYVMIQ